MSNGIKVVKRDGEEPINLDKIHKMVEHACFGLKRVVQVEINLVSSSTMVSRL